MSEGTSQPDSPFELAADATAVDAINRAPTSEAVRAASPEELQLLMALRNGSEAAFVSLVEQYHRALLRLALVFVPSKAIAEEVIQETWMGVLQGLSRFEGRSSLKTWIFRILTNRAKTFALREGRSVPFSSLSDAEVEAREPAVDPDRFFPPGGGHPGAWISLPENWEEIPEKHLLSQETYACIESAIEVLPPNQR